MKATGIDGTVLPPDRHPRARAGPLIGLWDYQDGVPGRGDAKVIPACGSRSSCRRRPGAEWGGQAVRMAQEEDMIIGADGKVRWA